MDTSKETLLNASVTRTWFIQEINPDKEIKDAGVPLFINGEFKEKMVRKIPQNSTEKAFYLSESIPKTGDVIRLEVSAPGFSSVTSEETVPEPVKIQSIRSQKYKKDLSDYYATEYIRFHITFRDDPLTSNYYGVKISYIIEYKTNEGNWAPLNYGYSEIVKIQSLQNKTVH